MRPFLRRGLLSVGTVTFLAVSVLGVGLPNASAVQGLRFGVSYGQKLEGLSSSELDATLADDVALGIGWVRLDFSWSEIQPTAGGAYNWAAQDRIVAAATAHGLSLLPELAYTPAWARNSACSGTMKCAPTDPRLFAAFASAAVVRYAPKGIHTWEIWNEENKASYWGPTANVTAYVALLKDAAAAIRSHDAAAIIVSGGLAPSSTSSISLSPIDFLTQFARQGGLALVDAVGDHPYSYPVPPGYKASWNAWQQISSTPTSLQSILNASGYGYKKIWATEYGAPTNGPGATATSANGYLVGTGLHPTHVDEALQAQMATDSVHLARASASMGALFWYSGKDIGTSTSTNQNFFGVRRYDGSAKPAWSALKTAIAGG